MQRSRVVIAVTVTAGLGLLLILSATSIAAELVKARDGSGIVGYKDTPVLPWCGYHVHDPDRPAPPKVTAGARRGAPSDTNDSNNVISTGLPASCNSFSSRRSPIVALK